MKPHLHLLVFGLMALACSKELPSNPEGDLREISLSPNLEIKSSFIRGASSVVWSLGDRLSVLDGSSNRRFMAILTSPKALFKGSISSGATSLTVVYPYHSMTAAGSGNSIDLVLPGIQWAVPGRLSDESILSVGRCSADDFTVSMKNVPGFVSFTLSGGFEKVTKIDFSSNGGEKVSGLLRVDYDGNSLPSVVSASGSSSVSICSPYPSLEAGEYYFSAIPGTLSSGFTLTFHREDGKVASVSSSKSNTIVRNRVLDLGTLDSSTLLWADEPKAQTRTLTLNLSPWPFDIPGGNSTCPDVNALYVTSEGYPYALSGEAYYASSALVLPNGYTSVTLPALPGCRLISVAHTSSSEVPGLYFTDIDDAPVSARDFENSSANREYRLFGTESGSAVKMKSTSSSSVSKLVLTYEILSESPEVVSVGSYDGSVGSFTFKNGSSSDFECGIEYIPSASDDWSNASVQKGSITSSTSSSAYFLSAIPDGKYKARVWVRPVSSGRESNRYGSLTYSSSSRKVLVLDFSKGVQFEKCGSAGGEGTFESPRTGLSFPTAKQTVTDQTTGATSNNGGSMYGTRSGTEKYWTNYPITKFNFTQGGVTYQFLLGTNISLYDAYLYHSSNSVYNNKLRCSIPGISGYRIASVTINALSSSNSYVYTFGSGTSYTNLGNTTPTTANTFTDMTISFPSSLEAGAGVNFRSDNAFRIGALSIEYIAVL